MGDLYALDFDGVICDSCGESSLSGLKAAKVKWPALFNDVDSSLENWVLDQMRIVRPVVETGYENLLLVRLLIEMRVASIRESSVAEGITVEGVLENWSELKPVIMEEWGEDRDDLIEMFGKVRDEWMDQDLKTWIGANRLYPGVADALKCASSTVYVVTTKQSRFADALLRELAGVTIPQERIFGLGSGPKVEVLKQLQKKPEHQGMKMHFVEDRLATLKNVIKEPELDGWNLYLGDWGYNTQKERDEACTIPRIQILQVSDFSKKLKLNSFDDISVKRTLGDSIFTPLHKLRRSSCMNRVAKVPIPFFHKLWRRINSAHLETSVTEKKAKKDRTELIAEMGDLYALDFDGVICDSCGESSLSAVKAAKVRWPTLFDGVDSALENWVVDQMHIVRPVVETGYENLLLVRLLVEMRVASIRKSTVAEGLTVDGILEKWSQLKPVIMAEWGEEDKDALIHLFGKVRDEWMDQDLNTWIGANRLYPGVSDALRFASSTIYIVTTKQGRFADALLQELAGVTIPPERIFGLGSGPKVKVLKLLQKKPEHQGLKLHFVEDRLATLKNVIKEPELDGWNLYLGDWGYNTEKERDEAAEISRIQIIQLSDFSKNLK